uniref:tRNA threonylcarbamoyladenosine dehydratase n=1 Tax=uncultured Alphaproteobacteria bacterium TaxID=91750 RepID=A0A6G8F2Z3_9PROT|nr:tRNA threonylcarbamoyladenosine dehydratase [uncultured Alphaproteobacteria bacterium]
MSDHRFMRTAALLGAEGFARLKKSSVMVIGLGAVGGYALEALARSGIGRLVLVDFDKVDETNINRQILALGSTVGQSKAMLAAAHVADINPDCKVEIKELFVNNETLPEILSEPVDFVVDAIDSLNPKCSLMEALANKSIPFISSMGAALKTDPSRICLQRLDKTSNCHLARFIRKRLKRRNVDISKILCVASDEQVNLPDTALFIDEENQPEGNTRQRHTMGSLPTITAIFGLTIANAVILSLSGLQH